MRGDRIIPRSHDERVLKALALKRKGVTWPKIAMQTGYTSEQGAWFACKNVRKADEAESGEDVSGCYW